VTCEKSSSSQGIDIWWHRIERHSQEHRAWHKVELSDSASHSVVRSWKVNSTIGKACTRRKKFGRMHVGSLTSFKSNTLRIIFRQGDKMVCVRGVENTLPDAICSSSFLVCVYYDRNLTVYLFVLTKSSCSSSSALSSCFFFSICSRIFLICSCSCFFAYWSS